MKSWPGSYPALLISLDFELYWGVRDFRPLHTHEKQRLLSARQVIPRLLSLFNEFDIHATWATVGFLFAESKRELEKFSPCVKPNYTDARLNPYTEEVGESEMDDPFHFAPSLIREIADTPGQEIGTHSFSHFYCLEEGQTVQAFQADLQSALAIASESGFQAQSFVFPRNQMDARYLGILRQSGLITYREAEPGHLYRPCTFRQQRYPHSRFSRLIRSYTKTSGISSYDLPSKGDLIALPASHYLSPYRPGLSLLEGKRRERILTALERSAKEGKIFHLWWHPEDFAIHPDRNMEFLESILSGFDSLRRTFGMQSVNMFEVGMRAVEPSQPAKTTLELKAHS